MQELEPVKEFNFSCFPGIRCFNRCCYDVSIPLTPSDVLRLSRGLKLHTSEFLKRYTKFQIGMATGLPVVILGNSESCPFVSEKGCRVYSFRPNACRLYPLVRMKMTSEEIFFLLREDFCLGHNEKRRWKVEEWLEDQKIDFELDDLFQELIAEKSKCEELEDEEIEQIYKYCFDIDTFKLESGIFDDQRAIFEGIKRSIEIVKRKVQQM